MKVCFLLVFSLLGTGKYIRQILTAIKGEIDSNTIIVDDFNTHLSMDRSSRQNSKEIQAFNDTLDQMVDQMDLIDLYKTFHPKSSRIHILKCTQNILQD